ncbi:MAG TPA: hypothetical protein VGJ32_17075 [Solirubrobacteraceae bacterium]
MEALDLADRVVFANGRGEWHVWKQLTWSGDGRRVVGPGYVGRLRRPDAARPLVDDLREPGPPNDPRLGGLGCFGWQHARRGLGSWDVHGRLDPARSGGFGVARSAVLAGPELDGDGVGHLRVRVELRDGWQDPVLAVEYAYRVEPQAVVCLVEVRQLWQPDGFGAAFVKEPKLVAAPAPVFEAVDVAAADGRLLRRVELARLPEPWVATAQVGEAERALVSFRGAAERLDVAMQAWSDERAATWEGARGGFDGWAQLAETREPLAEAGAGYCLGGRGGLRRRWEVARRVALPGVSCLFHAWEGGAGLFECPDASRAFGPAGESFSVLATYV